MNKKIWGKKIWTVHITYPKNAKKCDKAKQCFQGSHFEKFGGVLVMSSNPLLAGDHYIYCSWKPNDPCFDWKSEFGPCFGGLAFKNRGHFFGIPGICKV